MLWALFTVIAAAAQTVRNAAQRELTATLGTVGATHVRFLFGAPFALLFLTGVLLATGASSTLPLQIYTMIKVAVTPEVNAVSTLLMVLTLTMIVVASRLAPDALRGQG